MKKRLLVFGVVSCFLVTLTFTYAANTKVINATISGLEIYLNSMKKSGNVLTVKGVSYIPVNTLEDDYYIKTDKNKLDITEKVNKQDLSSENNRLTNENSQLKTTINELKNKLSKYEGVMPQGDGDLVHPLTIANHNNNSQYFTEEWNPQLPFKVNNKIYSKNAIGFSFKGNYSSSFSSDAPYSFFQIDNSKGLYSQVSWYSAKDDRSKNKVRSIIIATTTSGTKKYLTNSEYTEEKTNDGFSKYIVDMTGYSSMSYVLVSPYDNGLCNLTIDNNNIVISKPGDNAKTEEGYQVIIGPFAKSNISSGNVVHIP